MTNFDFLKDGNEQDDGTIRINTSRPRRKPAKPRKTFVQSLEDAERGMKAASDNLMGCGCGLILIGLLILSPFILAALL